MKTQTQNLIIPKAKVYVDGANMFYAQKHLGWTIDWKKILAFLKRKYNILESRYYTGLKKDDEKMMGYLRYLDTVGFSTVTKPLKKIRIRTDNIGTQFLYKANFDVEITVDVLLDKSKIDEIIIFSGDSDFEYLVKKLKNIGIKVNVFSSRKTVSWELKLSASKVTYLEDIRKIIQRKQKTAPITRSVL